LKTEKTTLKDFLIKFFFYGVLANLFASLLVGHYTHFSIGIVTFFGILAILYLTWLKRKLRILLSGIKGYYLSFSLEENPKIWESDVTNSFWYLGISGASIIAFFERWLSRLPAGNTFSFKFLLMNPDNSKIMKRQLSFRYNLNPENLSPDQEKKIEQEIATLSKQIISTVTRLKNTQPYIEGRLEIRYHDKFIPYWMYIFDERKAYVGILGKGEDGLESPVLIVHRDKTYSNVFNPFFHTWERIWEEAVSA